MSEENPYTPPQSLTDGNTVEEEQLAKTVRKIAAANLNNAPKRIRHEWKAAGEGNYELIIAEPYKGLDYGKDLEAILGKDGKWQSMEKGVYDVISIEAIQKLADAGVYISGGEHIGIKNKPAIGRMA